MKVPGFQPTSHEDPRLPAITVQGPYGCPCLDPIPRTQITPPPLTGQDGPSEREAGGASTEEKEEEGREGDASVVPCVGPPLVPQQRFQRLRHEANGAASHERGREEGSGIEGGGGHLARDGQRRLGLGVEGAISALVWRAPFLGGRHSCRAQTERQASRNRPVASRRCSDPRRREGLTRRDQAGRGERGSAGEGQGRDLVPWENSRDVFFRTHTGQIYPHALQGGQTGQK